MDDERAKGTTSDVKGKIKEAGGGLTGNEETKAKGQTQQTQGEAQKGLGDVKEKLSGDGSGNKR